MKKVFKKLLLSLLGLSLLASPILCCCFAPQPAVAETVQELPACHQRASAEGEANSQEESDCECFQIITTTAKPTWALKQDTSVSMYLVLPDLAESSFFVNTSQPYLHGPPDSYAGHLSLYIKHQSLLL